MMRIASIENLHEAFLRAAKGKTGKQAVVRFRENLDDNLHAIQNALLSGSQYFANHYLSVADHYLKEQLHVKAMVRYMDDILVFSHTKEELLSIVCMGMKYIKDELKIELHHPIVNRTLYGIPFLGYVVRRDALRLNQRSRKRFERKMSFLTKAVVEANIDERMFTERATCLFAFINKADVSDFKYRLSKKKGIYPQEIEPRETWRQLEQQRKELPCVESEQQQPV